MAPFPSSPVQKFNSADIGFVHGIKSRLKKLPRNRDVIVAGRHYTSLFINHNGWLFRYKILHSGKRQILDFILPGEIFGLQACLFNMSLYSVTTITDASVSVIPFEVVDDVFEQSPKLAKSLFWCAACEAAILSEHLIDTARRSAYERVSHLLLELHARMKSSGQTENMSFELPLTQELIADAIGLSAVHVNRTLRSLRNDNLIAVSGKQITLIDTEALAALCDFEHAYLGQAERLLQAERFKLKPIAPVDP